MKKTIFKSALLAIVGVGLMAGSAMATTVDVTYTADNIAGMWFIDSIATGFQPLGDNYNNWQIADTVTVSGLEADQDYTFVWSVTNAYAYNAGNPAAFLAELNLGDGLVVTDQNWTYSANQGDSMSFDGVGWNWFNVTEYGTNGGDNIWTDVHGGEIAGISTTANWIWSENNFEDGEWYEQSLWIRTDIHTAAAPVPEPATMLLFGTGLAGLAGIRRKKSKKA